MALATVAVMAVAVMVVTTEAVAVPAEATVAVTEQMWLARAGETLDAAKVWS